MPTLAVPQQLPTLSALHKEIFVSYSLSQTALREVWETYLYHRLTSESQAREEFMQHFVNRLSTLRALKAGWDSYGAEPPNDAAINATRAFLEVLSVFRLQPTHVVPSAEGGVALAFSGGDRHADIEFLNDGEVVAAIYQERTHPDVWEFAPGRAAFRNTAQRIRAFLVP